MTWTFLNENHPTRSICYICDQYLKCHSLHHVSALSIKTQTAQSSSFLSGFQSSVPWGSLISLKDVLVCKYQVIDNYLVSVCLVHVSLISAEFSRMKNNAAICPSSPVYQCPQSILSWESIGSHYLSPVTYLNCISLASSKLLPSCFYTHTHRFLILSCEEYKLRQGRDEDISIQREINDDSGFAWTRPECRLIHYGNIHCSLRHGGKIANASDCVIIFDLLPSQGFHKDQCGTELDCFYLTKSVIPDNILFPSYTVICGNTLRVIVKKKMFLSL